ncbi:hypothetical protein [Nostoc sp. DedQUE09]|uniref:hypothetical protein n=1 Tax=Nostoc sp. DedQUE09 TaxID=3075394 RepID=UPI002AD3A1D9|nr:hypothetical protein [Nostoc sp. DedQUE09]MDZ7955418.1 hypothetical protein [Nostoc sp. DedQUE09]
MSSLACPCGHVIKDVVWPLTYDSGVILCDTDEEHYFSKTAEALAELVAATVQGKRLEWMHKYLPHMQDPEYMSKPDAEIIENYMGNFSFYIRVIEQCEKCGRLHVQKKPGENLYCSFKPDGEWQSVLKDIGSQE